MSANPLLETKELQMQEVFDKEKLKEKLKLTNVDPPAQPPRIPPFDEMFINLTNLVKAGEISDAFAWYDEIYELAQILSQKNRNNVIYCGLARSGKIAVIKGLAYRLQKHEDYAKLRIAKKNIYMIDINSAEEYCEERKNYTYSIDRRVPDLINLIKYKYIDILKDNILIIPSKFKSIASRYRFLEDPEILMEENKVQYLFDIDQSKAKMTLPRFLKFFSTSSTIAEKSQVVKHRLPNEDEYDVLISSEVQLLENYHKVVIEKSARTCATSYSKQKNDTGQDLISLTALSYILDRACIAKVMKHDNKQSEVVVTAIDVETEIKFLDKIKQKENRKKFDTSPKALKELEETLYKNIKGQNAVLEIVLRRLKIGISPFAAKGKPRASFMFAGSTGTGKTFLTQNIAKVLNLPILRVDMSEFYKEHTVARFIGSPPGYVGSEGGQLTNYAKENKNAVLLLDEIDKAHPKILDAMLQVLDAGKLTSGTGEQVDMSGYIIVMTSNFGADDLKKANRNIGFGEHDENESKKTNQDIVKKALEKELRPEFINRFDEIVVFDPISEGVMLDLAKTKLKELALEAKELDLKLSFTPNVVKIIAKAGFNSVYGVRPLKRVIDEEIRYRVSMFLAENDFAGKSIKIKTLLSSHKINTLPKHELLSSIFIEKTIS